MSTKPIPPALADVPSDIPADSTPNQQRVFAFGLWALDLLENSVRQPKEASAIERLEQLGQTFGRLNTGKVVFSVWSFPLETEERIVVDGPDVKPVAIEEIVSFTKASEGFLDPKEELKIVRKRYGALIVFHRFQLRLERSHLAGLSIAPDANPDGFKKFALLLRTLPVGTPQEEKERLISEMRRQGISGITLHGKESLVKGVKVPAAQVLLTLMQKQFDSIPDSELHAWVAGFMRLASPGVITEVMNRLDVVTTGPRAGVLERAVLTSMETPLLLGWRDSLEQRGEQLAQQMVQALNPQERTELENQLRALPALLSKVNAAIPEEEKQKDEAKRREKFAQRQVAKAEEQSLQRVQASGHPILTEPDAFLEKLDKESDATNYRKLTQPVIDIINKLLAEKLDAARKFVELLARHSRATDTPWRRPIATSFVIECSQDHVLRRVFEILEGEDAEAREHAKAILVAYAGRVVPALVQRIETAPADAVAKVAIWTTTLHAIGEPAEAFLCERLNQDGEHPASLMRLGMELITKIKRADRLDLVGKFTRRKEPEVREQALRALATLDPVKGQQLIKRSIGDRDFAIARTSILLLGELKTTDWSVLSQFLDIVKRREKEQPEPDERLQLTVVQALGLVGNFQLKDGSMLDTYLCQLLLLEEKKLFGLMGSKMKEKSPRVRAAVCAALAELGTEKSLEALRDAATKTPDGDPMKEAAKDAIKSILSRNKK